MKAYFPTWDSCGSYEVMVTKDLDYDKFKKEMQRYSTVCLRKNVIYDSCAGERGVNDMSRDELLEIAWAKCYDDIRYGDVELSQMVNFNKTYNLWQLCSNTEMLFLGSFDRKREAMTYAKEFESSHQSYIGGNVPVCRFEIYHGKRVKQDEEGNPIYKQPCYVSDKFIEISNN